MAELEWLRSSPAKVATGSMSPSSFNSSSENLFDLLQGRLGNGTFGASDSSPFCRSSDQLNNSGDLDSASVLKAEQDSLQLELVVQPNIWMATETPMSGVVFNSTHVSPSVLESTQFSPYMKPPDPSPPQLQALREFMAYGSNNITQQTHHSITVDARIPSPPMFLHHLGDESPNSMLNGIPPIRTFVGENSSRTKPDMLAYRALCHSELFTTERSPHRSQFQRENHILAERQRREEMNEKFSALRSMIPKATKKDKASIVGDTISYVLELEKNLKHLQARKASRKSYLKLLKRTSSLKVTANCETSAMDTATETGEESKGVCPTRSDEERIQMQTIDLEIDEPAFSSSEQLMSVSEDSFEKVTKKEDGICNTEVDVQNLGQQSVIKIVCNRSPGLVLRILQALDECKVEILQSNVTTVAKSSVHFITIQTSLGSSSTTEEMINALHLASSPVVTSPK